MSTNAQNLVTVGFVLAEIFGGICRVLPSCPKSCRFCPRNLWVYWAHLTQICMECSKNIAIWYMWLKLRYSIPFRNASMLNEGQFANFAQNWLPWQFPLRNREKDVWIDKSQTCTFHIVKKIGKIGPLDPEIIWLKKEEINASKIYSPFGKRAK